jgi:hypothetical protein
MFPGRYIFSDGEILFSDVTGSGKQVSDSSFARKIVINGDKGS